MAQCSVVPIQFCKRWRSDPANKFYLDIVARGETPGIVKVRTKYVLCLSKYVLCLSENVNVDESERVSGRVCARSGQLHI